MAQAVSPGLGGKASRRDGDELAEGRPLRRLRSRGRVTKRPAQLADHASRLLSNRLHLPSRRSLLLARLLARIRIAPTPRHADRARLRRLRRDVQAEAFGCQDVFRSLSAALAEAS